MRICIDLDGVICRIREQQEGYEGLEPVEGAVEKIRNLKKNGHYIIIYSARRMKTHDGNVGKATADIGKITLEWLESYGILYDEIILGKPWADIYIDDNAVRFEGWDKIADDGSNLPISAERRLRGG